MSTLGLNSDRLAIVLHAWDDVANIENAGLHDELN